MFAPWRHDIASAPWNAAVACGEACLHKLVSRYISTGLFTAPRSRPDAPGACQGAVMLIKLLFLPAAFHCCPGSLAAVTRARSDQDAAQRFEDLRQKGLI
jgi:hypothetical protein